MRFLLWGPPGRHTLEPERWKELCGCRERQLCPDAHICCRDVAERLDPRENSRESAAACWEAEITACVCGCLKVACRTLIGAGCVRFFLFAILSVGTRSPGASHATRSSRRQRQHGLTAGGGAFHGEEAGGLRGRRRRAFVLCAPAHR